jgi:UDP-N-acetylglucosamine transferase subunit ALG13
MTVLRVAPGSAGTPVQLRPQRIAQPIPSPWIRPGRTLLVASTGGHLDELVTLRQRFLPELEDVEWATFDTGQARQLLAGEVVHFVPFVRPKDARGTVLNSVVAGKLLGTHRFTRVVSTGAAVAVPFLAAARSFGLAAHYIESAARSQGLSLSGAMVSRIPGVRLYGQYPGWTSGRWQFRGSVFDGFEPGRKHQTTALKRVVVTFGTQRGFGFRRAAERLAALLPEVCEPDASVLWQTGATDTTGLPINGVGEVPVAELDQAIAEADLVVSHAGVGSAMHALDHGRCPVLLPRDRDFSEHTDQHQRLVAEELGQRGLAVAIDPDRATAEHLWLAAGMRVERAVRPPRFTLQPD